MGLNFSDGAGKHPSGDWPAEESFLVLGVTADNAKVMGIRFEQNAVVWCASEAVPQLVLIR